MDDVLYPLFFSNDDYRVGSQGIFGQVRDVKKRISRFIVRISPLNRTCYGDVGEIVKLAKVRSYTTHTAPYGFRLVLL